MAQKIIVRAPNHLGDCIMALPMINETREAYPGSTVAVLLPDYLADLLASNPAIDRVLTIPGRYVHGLIAVKKITDILKPENFDIGYILPPSFGAASSFKLAGVRERIGYIADGRRLLLSRPLPLPSPLNSEHRSEVYFNLLRRGAKVDLTYGRPKLFLNDQDAQKAAEILAVFGIGAEDKYAVIAFRAVAESRRWGMENYISLASAIMSRYACKIVLAGGSADSPDGDVIVKTLASPNVANMAGKTSLRETAAIMSRSMFFVGNDSGPAHLAAAVGIPIVVLSGADDPKETSPISTKKRLIYLSHLDCISCVKNRCPLKGGQRMQCMTGISVEMTTAAIADILSAS
jgi:heptosyltransferase-2